MESTHSGYDTVRPLPRASVLLHAGIPLTLLMDLADPAGPPSRALYAAESADLTWLRRTG